MSLWPMIVIDRNQNKQLAYVCFIYGPLLPTWVAWTQKTLSFISITELIWIRRHKLIYDNDTEAPSGQPKTRWKRCSLSRRKNWSCDNVVWLYNSIAGIAKWISNQFIVKQQQNLKDSLLASSPAPCPSQLKRSATKIPVGVSRSPLNGDRCAEGLDGHFSCSRRRRSICPFFCWTYRTVDQGILLHRLDSSYQIVGSVQQWF